MQLERDRIMIKIRVSQIFTRQVEDAASARKALDSGTAFADVVARFSECPSKSAGGDLGWMPQDNMTGLFGAQLNAEDKGKIFGPIHSQYGYHILVLTDIQEESEGGENPFAPETSMKQVQQMLPDVHGLLFRQFKIGMPVFGYKEGETLGSVCNGQNKPVEEVAAFLNREYGKNSFPAISGEDLRDKLKKGEGVVILDIREQWEYDIAHIEPSVLITAQNNREVLESLDPESDIVVVDWKGERSASFCKWLKGRGIKSVRCLQGGIDDWAARMDTRLSRYDIDDDDGYRYEDVLAEDTPN